tara:strand:- start:330 stop:818 length:489 start_codon:yes stop_codon:yes gene_type:complete
MNNREYILDWYRNHIWTRPKPSKVCDGVGSFAIRDIPKGTSLYDLAEKSCTSYVTWEIIKTLPSGIIQMICDLQVSQGTNIFDKNFKWKEEYGLLWIYTTKGLNWQTTWFFQNHSDNPNVDGFATDNPRLFKFITNRDIKKGEELFDNYDGYVKEWVVSSKI